MALSLLEFEKPLDEIEKELEGLRSQAEATGEGDEARIDLLQGELDAKRSKIFARLKPWQRVQVARHPARPRSLDYIRWMLTDWTELKGDRRFGDDKAVVTGFGKFEGRPVAAIGQQKGIDTKDNITRNFGMMHPEGYRKALRIMQVAEKFKIPILIFIDTQGAFPGIGAEERGQAEAIAWNMMQMSGVCVPIICSVIGEGASGGALGLGVGDRLIMLEYAWYSVITPEGCAAILWRDSARAAEAAEALKLTAEDLDRFGLVDEIVPEPLGGAHRNHGETASNLKAAIGRHLDELVKIESDALVDQRFERYRTIGETEG